MLTDYNCQLQVSRVGITFSCYTSQHSICLHVESSRRNRERMLHPKIEEREHIVLINACQLPLLVQVLAAVFPQQINIY